MSLSMHGISAPAFLLGLGGLAHVLGKAETHAAERGLDAAALTAARLFEDMFPLTRQVQIATDHAKGAMARLGGREVPKWEDTETSFAELQARIEKAVGFVNSVPPEALVGSETKPITIPTGRGNMDFDGFGYLQTFALPNFWFHVTTAYDILRMKGVPLGKRDFFGRA
jgi:uncharacterized protein